MRLLPLLVLLPGLAWSASWVLPYQGDNKWVAASDNATLIAVMRAARKGTTYFKVRLPEARRDLGIARLEVLRDLLAREAGRGIVLEEIGGTAAAGTIWVSDK